MPELTIDNILKMRVKNALPYLNQIVMAVNYTDAPYRIPNMAVITQEELNERCASKPAPTLDQIREAIDDVLNDRWTEIFDEALETLKLRQQPPEPEDPSFQEYFDGINDQEFSDTIAALKQRDARIVEYNIVGAMVELQDKDDKVIETITLAEFEALYFSRSQ